MKWIWILLLLSASLYAEPFGKPKTTVLGKYTQLVFADQTVIRTGANAGFQFIPGTREILLENGTLLFSSPKGAGGGLIHARTAVVTLTEGDLQMSRINDQVKVICMTGKVIVSSTANLKARDGLRPGEMIVIPAGATKMPTTSIINLATMISTSGLMKAGPLPSQSLIERNAGKQKGPPKTSPPGANNAETAAAMATVQISEQQAIQQLAAQQQAADQAAAAAQIVAARQFAAQQASLRQAEFARQAAADQERQRQVEIQQQQTASQRVSQGNQGQGPQGNQGQGNDKIPPGQAKK